MIAIVNSGGANLASVIFAIERLGKPYVFTADPDVITKASHVILPGVGTAAMAMKVLNQNGLVDCLRGLTQPVIGICLGMQLLFEFSVEGDVDLLGLLPGRVNKFASATLPVPHMGWNRLDVKRDNPLLKGLEPDPYVYYVHSYYAAVGDYTVASTDYAVPFSGMVNRGNIFGCQFHPERSGKTGAQILKNFTEL